MTPMAIDTDVVKKEENDNASETPTTQEVESKQELEPVATAVKIEGYEVGERGEVANDKELNQESEKTETPAEPPKSKVQLLELMDEVDAEIAKMETKLKDLKDAQEAALER